MNYLIIFFHIHYQKSKKNIMNEKEKDKTEITNVCVQEEKHKQNNNHLGGSSVKLTHCV